MYKCNVCGEEFVLNFYEHYISRDGDKKGVFSALVITNETSLFDTFDCPHCGCQNVIQQRKRALIEDPSFNENEYAEVEEDEEQIELEEYNGMPEEERIYLAEQMRFLTR